MEGVQRHRSSGASCPGDALAILPSAKPIAVEGEADLNESRIQLLLLPASVLEEPRGEDCAVISKGSFGSSLPNFGGDHLN
jgi:hypothetical protein